jgi:hypothetical protein
MEPRPNVGKRPQGYSEASTAHSKPRLKSRFVIEPLEERIAPDKGGGHGGGMPSSSGDPVPPIVG